MDRLDWKFDKGRVVWLAIVWSVLIAAGLIVAGYLLHVGWELL